MKLLDVHTMNLHAIEEEDIVSVTVYFDGGDSWMEFADVSEAMNKFGCDAEVAETNIDKHGTLHVLLKETERDSEQEAAAGQSDSQEQDITTMASKLAFLYGKHNEMMERAHYANLKRDSAVEMDYLKSGDRLYKAIRNSEERLRRAGAEVRRTDGDFPWYHITSAVIKLGGQIIAAYPEENAAGKFVVTGQCRRDLARCETREEAEVVRERIGGYDIIPVEDYEEPDEDCDCAAWNFSRERIEELASVVAEDVNDPDPEKEWDWDSIGALLAVAGFYGEREYAKMDACNSPKELNALLFEELRQAERICNVRIFNAA